jgi:hypothetical protein
MFSLDLIPIHGAGTTGVGTDGAGIEVGTLGEAGTPGVEMLGSSIHTVLQTGVVVSDTGPDISTMYR